MPDPDPIAALQRIEEEMRGWQRVRIIWPYRSMPNGNLGDWADRLAQIRTAVQSALLEAESLQVVDPDSESVKSPMNQHEHNVAADACSRCLSITCQCGT